MKCFRRPFESAGERQGFVSLHYQQGLQQQAEAPLTSPHVLEGKFGPSDSGDSIVLPYLQSEN